MTPNTKKPSEEIAIQIREHERIYEDHLKESRKLIEIENKRNIQTKKQVLLKAGKLLERYSLVTPDRISSRLQRDYKDLIAPQTIRYVIMSERLQWTMKSKGRRKNKGAKQLISFDKIVNISANELEAEEMPLTKQEEEYVEAARVQAITDKKIEEMIFFWTGKDQAAQGEIIRKTPKGKHWAQELAEESIEYMRTTALRMTDSDIVARLNDLRAFEYIRTAFSDAIYKVYEERQRTKTLNSE